MNDPNVIPLGKAASRVAGRFRVLDGGKSDMIDTSYGTMEQLKQSAALLARNQIQMDARKLAALCGIRPTIEFLQGIIRELAEGIQP